MFHAWIVLLLIPRWSVTYNEAGHIPAGLACWYTRAFDVYRVNPPVPRMVATLALLNQPTICLEAIARLGDRPAARQEFELGTYFADTNALEYHQIICRARLAGIFWITLGGAIVWRWAAKLFGQVGGIVALVLWTFEPSITAHAALATPDVPATVMGLAATYAFAHLLQTGSWFHTYIGGVLLGVALLCKFTLLLLVPAWAIAWLLARYSKVPGAIQAPPARPHFSQIVFLGCVAWLTLNAGYGFVGTGTPLGKLAFLSESFKNVAARVENTWLAVLPCPVPSAYIRGIDTQQRDFEGGMNSYLNGEWQNHGWWHYYMFAFGVKSPLGHLAIYGLALVTAIVRRHFIPVLLWLPPVLIAGIASMKSGYTDHLRYILPAYPFIVIMSGAVVSSGARFGSRAIRGVLIAGLLSWSAASMLWAFPHLLGYFNQTVGGSLEGWRHLSGSNVDWGQDWVFLREWLAANPQSRPMHIALISHLDKRLYLRQQYPIPTRTMSGYAVVDAQCLTQEYQWLLAHPVVARIGTSLFVFEVRP